MRVPIEELGPVAQAATVVLLGVLVGVLMGPLHAATARRRRTALLVDRVVTDRISRLEGTERRRAWRHLHRQAGFPAVRALGFAAATAAVTVAATLATASTVDWSLVEGRREALRRMILRFDAAGLPTPTLAGALVASGVVVVAVCALVVAVAHVGALDVERRRAMPVTRPWPLSRRRATVLTALVLGAVLLIADTAVAPALFLLGHQVVARWRRPAACRVAPVVPEALRAARLPVTRERRLLRARRPVPPVAAGPAGAAAAAPLARRPGGPVPGSPVPARPAPGRPATPHPPTASTRLVDLAAPEQPLNPHDPRQVGEYTLTGRLGSGGMGTVYLGHRAGTTGVVAVKVLAPHLLDDVDARTRFLREGRTLQQVTGDYTARVHGVGFDGSMPYIVMERLDGPSLHAFVCASGAVTEGEMLTRTAIALARALAALHADGITHRDLKPGNILLTSAGPKVVDFGIARVVGQTHHTPAGNMVGTPGYMAPEQVTGNGAVPASDVWAWACCVVFAARGDHLFDGENIVDIARRILDGPGADDFAAVGRLSPRLVPVLRRATAQEAADRPRDGAALLRLLDRSGATATVGSAGWDRLIGAGAR
jgi:hypothetical protein